MAAGILGVLAVGLTWLASRLLEVAGVAIPWWLGTPSVMGSFASLWWAYDTVGWRARTGPIRLSSIPDLQGTWVGTITSTHDGGSQKPAVLRIRQRWSRMQICLETEHSKSRSTMAAVCSDEAVDPGLSYEYLNEPRALSDSRMQIHRGSANLRLDPRTTTLTGDYYTGRGRQNFGQIAFARLSTADLTWDEAMAATKAGGLDGT